LARAKALLKENPRVAFSYRSLLAVAVTLPLALVVACGTAADHSGAAARTAGDASARSGGTSSIPTSPATARLTLAETGSTLLYPLFQTWASAYHQQFSAVTITTAGTGSSTGIDDAAAGKVEFGASDAFLSSGNLVQNPDLLNLPLAISAQEVDYNVPGVSAGVHIKLTGSVLAQMYQGLITRWNDHAITSLNPGVPLSGTPIVLLRRAQTVASPGSGDTFLFTSYLSATDQAWSKTIGYGTAVAWPNVPGELSEPSNSEMVSTCEATKGCIAYIGISALPTVAGSGLGEAAIANAAGSYVLPDSSTVSSTVNGFLSAIPDNETISMVNGPTSAASPGYPIVNFEYAIVSRHQPDATKAQDIKAFLHWVITTGNEHRFLRPVGFQPLPASVVTLTDDQIARIR
jgi:phosphate transport system substrate-binding protein